MPAYASPAADSEPAQLFVTDLTRNAMNDSAEQIAA